MNPNIRTDHLNAPRLVADEANAIIWRNGPLAEPFGNSEPEEDPDGDGQDFTLNLRFPGQYYDKETGTHYNYFRDYSPLTGRYLQPDPIGLDGGINPYAYADGNPLSYTDPEGLLSTAACANPANAAACAAAGIAARGSASLSRPAPIPVPMPVPIPKERDLCGDMPCPPCKTISGKVVPVGMIAYRPLDTPNRPQHGIVGSHYNIYKANQYPAPKCDCFWQPLGSVPPSGLPTDSIPIEPFAN